MPSTARSNVQYAPPTSSSAQNAKMERRRMPPIAQPTNARRPVIPRRSSQAFARFRAAISAASY
jgi:hypothetical protein